MAAPEDKYGKNFSPSPAADFRAGSSSLPLLQRISPAASLSPNRSTSKLLLQMTCTAFPCSKQGWHNSCCACSSSLGSLDPNRAACQHQKGFPIQGFGCSRFRLVEPRNGFICFKQTRQNCKQCQEAQAGQQPSGKSNQARARKIHQQAWSSPVASCSHPCPMLSVKRNHPPKLAPFHPSLRAPCCWKSCCCTPDPIHHLTQFLSQLGKSLLNRGVRSRLGKQGSNCSAGQHLEIPRSSQDLTL